MMVERFIRRTNRRFVSPQHLLYLCAVARHMEVELKFPLSFLFANFFFSFCRPAGLRPIRPSCGPPAGAQASCLPIRPTGLRPTCLSASCLPAYGPSASCLCGPSGRLRAGRAPSGHAGKIPPTALRAAQPAFFRRKKYPLWQEMEQKWSKLSSKSS